MTLRDDGRRDPSLRFVSYTSGAASLIRRDAQQEEEVKELLKQKTATALVMRSAALATTLIMCIGVLGCGGPPEESIKQTHDKASAEPSCYPDTNPNCTPPPPPVPPCSTDTDCAPCGMSCIHNSPGDTGTCVLAAQCLGDPVDCHGLGTCMSGQYCIYQYTPDISFVGCGVIDGCCG
jgi:hypothetical protein